MTQTRKPVCSLILIHRKQVCESDTHTSLTLALIAVSICSALEATLADSSMDASTAESGASQHRAAAMKLLQQSVTVVEMQPEQLFPGLVQRLQEEMKDLYEDRLKTAEKKAVLAQVLLICKMTCSLLEVNNCLTIPIRLFVNICQASCIVMITSCLGPCDVQAAVSAWQTLSALSCIPADLLL